MATRLYIGHGTGFDIPTREARRIACKVLVYQDVSCPTRRKNYSSFWAAKPPDNRELRRSGAQHRLSTFDPRPIPAIRVSWERIHAGKLSGLRLAKRTGFEQAHISNFLSRKRSLSVEGMDRVLAAANLSVYDLLSREELNSRRA